MDHAGDERGLPRSLTPLFECLRHRRRRLCLTALYRYRGEMSLSDLATQVLALEQDRPLVDVTASDHHELLVALHHIHVGRLQESSLVAFDADERTVRSRNEQALRHLGLWDIVTDPDRARQPHWDRLFDSLSSLRSRYVLGILEGHGRYLSLDALADRVLAHERPDGVNDVSAAERHSTLVSLYHGRLPKLVDAGLVEYDETGDAVRYVPDQHLRRRWLEANLREHISTLFESEGGQDIRVIYGHDDVMGRGAELIDGAREELFVMYNAETVFTDSCIECFQSAMDRGVRLYLGSQNPAVRDVARERLSRATVWEPRMNWMNLPTRGDNVGRLVFADRESILVGSFGTEEGDEVREIALVGEGESNPLVHLVSDILASRLDHLDEQSADFLDHIPL